MIPEAAPFNEWYSNPNQLQALDVPEYKITKLQAGRTFAVAYRGEGLHRGRLSVLRAEEGEGSPHHYEQLHQGE